MLKDIPKQVPRKVMLIIMDGWGKGEKTKSNAIYWSGAMNVEYMYGRKPSTELLTSGEAVGLPAGQMGNSEVGHLNIGAGRIVYQELERISKAIRDGELEKNTELQAAFAHAKEQGKTLHFIGLVSDGGVHSHIDHIKAMCSMAHNAGVPHTIVHAFTDGRDTDPKSGLGFIKDLQEHIQTTGAELASVTGRFYAMDRDKRWERVKVAYDALVHGTGVHTANAHEAIEASYNVGITDEFIKPIIVCNPAGEPVATIKNGDVVICFNFRTDRCREITSVLTQEALHEYNMSPLPLYYVTMTEYDKAFKDVHILFENSDIKNTLGEVISKNGKTQIRIAETEKYPHVTFFFNGGREEPFEGERRIMIPSPREVATYDQKPEMSAYEITDAIIPEIKAQSADFICLNFANADMVGHTGNYEAVMKAVSVVDDCVEKLVNIATENGYSVLLTADHGNAEYMINEDGTPNTQHTTNPVPLFYIRKGNQDQTIRYGKLGDLAPTILYEMAIPVPPEMTGEVLFLWYVEVSSS